MALSTAEQVVIGLGVALLFALLLWWGHVWSARRIARWCDEQGFELVDWRGARFFEGPHAWFRSENQDAYRIEVRDRDGLIRAGYLVFGSYWWGWPFSRTGRVEWD